MENKHIYIVLLVLMAINQISFSQQSPIREIIPDPESFFITKVDIASDERLIATCFKKVQIIDVDTGQIVQEHNEHELLKQRPTFPVGINALSFSNDNNLVASGDNLFNIVVWDRKQNIRLNHFFSTNTDPTGGGVIDVAVLPDNKRVLSANGNGTIELWSIETGELIRTYRKFGSIDSMILFSDGKRAIINTGSIILLNLETDEIIHVFSGISPSVSSDNTILQIVSLNQSQDKVVIQHWNILTNEKIREIPFPENKSSKTMDLSPDAKNFLIGNSIIQNGMTSITNRVLFDAVTPGSIRSYTARANADKNSPESEDQIIKYFPNGRKFLTVNGNAVHIWDISDVVTRIRDAGVYDN